MSRCETRASQRSAAERSRSRWLAECARYWAAEAERAVVAARIRALAAKLRGGDYLGRRDDLDELDRLWALVTRRCR